MNTFIEAQCKNITVMVKNFVNSCEIAAKLDDGQISKTEAKQLKKIQTAAEKFIKELEQIK